MNAELIAAYLFIVALLVSLVVLERLQLTTARLGLVATLGTVAAIGRIAVPVIPGFQLTTFTIIVSGIAFGPAVGFSTAVLAVLVSNFFLGHGPWTAFQMIAWGMCGACSGYFGHLVRFHTPLPLAIWGAAWGMLFGWTLNAWQWLAFITPLTLSSWTAVNLTSLPADLTHALTNGALLACCGHEIVVALRRFNNRLSFERI